MPRPLSLAGTYLAARHASTLRDVNAAATYYRAALRGDPRNSELLSRAFIALLANGEVDDAVKLAERVGHWMIHGKEMTAQDLPPQPRA